MTTSFRRRLDVLGWLGLVGLVLVGWAVERMDRKTWHDVLVARLAFAGVTTVGWMFDRLPPSTAEMGNRPSVPRKEPLSAPH